MAETVRATSINENPLCSRLQKKFEGRGAASAGTKAVKNAYSAAVDTKFARNANPFEETADFVRAGTTKRVAKTAVAYKATAKAAPKATVYNSASLEKTATFDKVTFAKAYSRAADIRSQAINFDASTRKIPRVTKKDTKVKQEKKEKVSILQAIKNFVVGDSAEERVVRSTPISKGLVLSAIVIALIVILMLFTLAQINEFKNEISSLENERAQLLTQIDDLNVAIDAKNDIRMIEDEATNRIGMVKSNQVATKYVSISGGERVEVVDSVEETAEAEYGVFGTLMSVMGSNWDHLMEYIN